ncbi:hypothetical protein HAQ40_002971 [Salmonella enterica]|nr:hypothetical protein [Salmonella enterica]EEL3024915.1 hypothetical protein [Salmonella enterica]
MKAEELKHFRKGIKDVKHMLSIVERRLNDGRYEAAEEFMRGEASLLHNLANELRDVIEIQQAEK